MGLADTVTKVYMKENTVFADTFNYLIYGGKAVHQIPAQLRELIQQNCFCRLVRRMRTENSRITQYKYRDVLKSTVIKRIEKQLTSF